MIESLCTNENLKPPNFLTVTTGFSNIHISSNERLPVFTDSVMKEADLRLPGGFLSHNVGHKINPKETDVLLEIERDDSPALETFSANRFRLNGPLDNEGFVKQIPYITYNCSERIRQERMNLTTVHSVSLVTPDGQGVLILGDKGSGKTALSIALAIDKGYQLLGNDLTLLQNTEAELSLVTGSRMMDIRLGVILHYFPHLEKHILGEIGNNFYESKISVDPEDIGLPLIEGNFPLACIIRINIHPFNDTTQIEKGAKRGKEQLRLYENLSRYIKGMTTPLVLTENGPLGLFPSIDTEELSRKRNILVQNLLSFPNFYYVSSKDPMVASSNIVNLLKRI